MSQITYQRYGGTAEALSYTYDNAGNIATISENGVLKAAYTYDQFGQLVREDNAWADRTYLYHYDNGGNLTMVQECYYRTGTMHQTDLIQNISYTYGGCHDRRDARMERSADQLQREYHHLRRHRQPAELAWDRQP